MITPQLLKQPNQLNTELLNKSGRLFTFLNPVSYLQARKHVKKYEKFNCLLADGWLFVAALRAIGIKAHRFSFDMTSLAPIVFQRAIEGKKSVYFLGAKPDEITKFIAIISDHFPDLIIKGYRNGYFTDSKDRSRTIRHIFELSPDIVIAGLGVPLQEKFLIDLQSQGWQGCGYTCGGFIHQTSQGLHYYPDWVNKYHLRMPYRFIKEPHFRSRIPDYFKFIFIFLYDYWQYKRGLK
jgi:exopolysaccharide biosynthesis WecB/TagA/CpsF family protein